MNSNAMQHNPTVVTTVTMVLPTGMQLDHQDVSSLALFVRWTRSGWLVTTVSVEHWLSVKGRKWAMHVPRRNALFYYFPSYDAAVAAACEAVDAQTVYGRTFSQWQDRA